MGREELEEADRPTDRLSGRRRGGCPTDCPTDLMPDKTRHISISLLLSFPSEYQNVFIARTPNSYLSLQMEAKRRVSPSHRGFARPSVHPCLSAIERCLLQIAFEQIDAIFSV